MSASRSGRPHVCSALSGLAAPSLAAIAEQRRTEPRALVRQVRGDLDWVVMKALDNDRTRRHGSAAELAADIRHYLRREPVSAGPPTVRYRVRKFVHRNRAWLLVCRLRLSAFDSCEGILLERWRELSQRLGGTACFAKAAADLVALYEAWDRPAQAEPWRVIMRELTRSKSAPDSQPASAPEQ